MRLYPAIDLKDGKCVRLIQGDYNEVTIFGDDPAEMAKKWESQGGKYLHLVDLDGAKAGKGINDEAIKSIIQAVTIPVELGGGIRTLEDIKAKLELGVDRVILGSVAVSHLDLVREAVERYGSDKIVVGVDAKEGKVAVEGWLEVSTRTALEFCRELKGVGVKTVIYTDIAKDGMMQGPNIDATKQLIDETGMDVVASGGVATLEDLKRVEMIGAEGAIIGKALYIDAIDLKEAVALFEK